MSQMIILLIRFYQKFLSLDTGIIGKLYSHQPTCRFHPRCSEYTIQAIEKYGTTRGVFRGIKRVGKCHPWNEGGVDLP